ncbi:MAG: hypothetical protein ACUZ8O_02900 [Candidatus Anammoxibacter sp.]
MSRKTSVIVFFSFLNLHGYHENPNHQDDFSLFYVFCDMIISGNKLFL